MPNEITIREYREPDKSAILRLLRLNTPAYFAPEEEADLEYYLEHETEHYFVVETEGQLIGCGGINLLDNGRTGRISWDILHPGCHGKGIGTKLLKHRINLLKATAGIENIDVRTTQLVFKFYEKNGFGLSVIIKNYWAPGLDMYKMLYTR